MRALIVVDMQHDFTYGRFKNKKAISIIKNINKVIHFARKKGWIIIFTKDSHIKGDFEFNIWGEHTLKDSNGARLVNELNVEDNDIFIEKRYYDAFFNTDLDGILREKGVKDVFICGVATHICVMHTSIGAFYRRYNIYLIKDCIASFDDEWHKKALKYMKDVLGVKIVSIKDMITT